MKYSLLFCGLLCLSLSQLQSQALYTVQIGTFLDVRANDFDPLRSFGFIYAKPLDGGLTQVFLGNYSDRSEADRMAATLRQNGYNNANALTIPLDQGQEVMMIQIATRQISEPIDWQSLRRAGTLYGLIDGSSIKILTGPYNTFELAQAGLPSVRQYGYPDAFLKRVNSAALVPLRTFETGIKEELIPLTLRTENSPSRPQSFEMRVPEPQLTARSSTDARTPSRVVNQSPSAGAALPNIRTRIKRRSVLELQKALKTLGFYSKSLDGYYGTGTQTAYERSLQELPAFQKYQVLAAAGLSGTSTQGAEDRLQRTINTLDSDLAAVAVLETMQHPIADAYQAYYFFVTRGPNETVNQLMNRAIQTAYSGKNLASQPPFDFRATYAYRDLDQLLLHLHYIHAAPGIEYAVPCWLYERHPEEANRAQARMAAYVGAEVKFQGCDSFLEYPEVKILRTIAWDIAAGNADQGLVTEAASRRAQLFLASEPLSAVSAQTVNAWDQRLWQNLAVWANQDPMHLQAVQVMQIAYRQSQTRIEDYFMDRGFNAEEAKDLALATMQALVGVQLARFV